MKRYNKNIIKTINAALILILLLSLTLTLFTLFFRIKGSEMRFGSYSLFRIVTGSMEPEYKIGDFVLVKKADGFVLEAGDVIAFVSPDEELRGQIIIHRVVEADGGFITTMGDANPTKDYNTVEKDKVLGRVTRRVTILRKIERAVSSAPVFFTMIILPIIFMAFNEVLLLTSERRAYLAIKSAISARGLDPKDAALVNLVRQYGADVLDEIAHTKKTEGVLDDEK